MGFKRFSRMDDEVLVNETWGNAFFFCSLETCWCLGTQD